MCESFWWLRPYNLVKLSSTGSLHDDTLARRMCRSCVTQPICDRCDGEHASEECPHFRWSRGDHPDAKKMPAAERPLPSTDAPALIARGRLIRQKPDGSCLYHSFAHGLLVLTGIERGAKPLRSALAEWARRHGPRMRIAGSSLRQWLHWETGGSETLETYVERQVVSGWGGVVEIIAMANEFKLPVQVWIPENASVVARTGRGRFRRTAVFEPDGGCAGKALNVARLGSVHYDYLELDDEV